MAFLIVMCQNCGGLLLAKTEHKTRTCPYCGSKVTLEKTRKIASAKNANEALAILQRMKRDSATQKEKY